MMNVYGTLNIHSDKKASYFVAYDEEMVSKTKIIELEFSMNVRDVPPGEIEKRIREQLGNVYIKSIGRIN